MKQILLLSGLVLSTLNLIAGGGGGGGGPTGFTCASAIPIASLPYSQTGLNTSGAGDDYSSADACGSSYMNGDDYVFTYTPSANQCLNIVLSNTSTWVGVFLTADCPSAAAATCVAMGTSSGGNPSIMGAAVTAGTTYYITVSTFPSPQSTPFDISVTAVTCPVTPANDNCPGAIALSVSSGITCTTATAGTINLATASTQSNGCGGTTNDDVWYSFVATNTTHYVTLSNVTGSTTDLYHSVYGGSCASPGAALVCSDPNSSTVTGLTVGNTYYVRVYSWSSSSGATTSFDICITSPPPPPANNNCSGAVALTVNTGAVCTSVTSGYCQGATQSQAGCLGTADDDVWYSFTALSTEHDVTLSNITGTTDLVHQVFSGSCGSLTSVGCSDPNTSSLSGLTVGATYFVRVYTWSSAGANTGFDICITSPCGITATPPSCSLSYSVSSTSYNPSSYTAGTLISFPDDQFAPSYTSIGFPFCFDGVFYNEVLISSNGYVTFPGCYSSHPLGTDVAPANYSGYSISAAAPNTTNAPLNAILGTWQDIYPSSTSTADGEIRVQLTGTSPNRVFTISYRNVRMYSCTSLDFNGQIKLYETTNNIEIHVGEKTLCSTWNGGAAILGITDYTGTSAVIPSGYNYPTQWTVPTGSPVGFVFSTTCLACNSILPVELLSFTGSAGDGFNELNWLTGSEINNAHFVIEKSVDANTFVPIGIVKGMGESRSENSYEFRDYKPGQRINYYRLRQVDIDGRVQFSEIISIDNTRSNAGVTVTPNPSAGSFGIEWQNASEGPVTISVFNVNGKQVLSLDFNAGRGINRREADLSALPAGVYYLFIRNSAGEKIGSEKLVKR